MIERFEHHLPRIDETAYVHPAAIVIGDVVVGAESSIWPTATLRGDDGPIVVGAQSSIQDGCILHDTEGLSTTRVGDRVTVGHRAILHGCTIESACIIGMGSIILDGAHIEEHCIIGAGALIPPGRRVPAGSVVVGNPMRTLRSCTERDLAAIEAGWQEYVRRVHQYRQRDRTTPP